MERYLVTLPACPDWSRQSGTDFSNQPHSNFGCATQSNLGMTVAEPKDLVSGRTLAPADGVVEITADRDELLARLAKRAEIEGREDDTEEAIARRLDIYAEQTAPLTAAYDERGLLVRVDGIGEIDDVTGRIVSALAPLVG